MVPVGQVSSCPWDTWFIGSGTNGLAARSAYGYPKDSSKPSLAAKECAASVFVHAHGVSHIYIYVHIKYHVCFARYCFSTFYRGRVVSFDTVLCMVCEITPHGSAC